MGMTLTEKILAKNAGVDHCKPGEILDVAVDLAMGNELSSDVAIKVFKKAGATKVHDINKCAFVPDHFVPAKDIASANIGRRLREFVEEQGIENYFEVGRGGIEHVVIPDAGLVKPDMVIIGGDSHTCTYGALGAFATGVGSTDLAVALMTGKAWMRVPPTIKFILNGELSGWTAAKDLILRLIREVKVDGARYHAVEFTGTAIDTMPQVGRFTVSNMTIEMGGKNGLVIPDETTRAWLKEKGVDDGDYLVPDDDAEYAQVIEIDIGELEPQVAFPHSPDNGRDLSQVGDIKIDSVVIGSCTNGRIEDLRIAAKVMEGKTLSPRIRAIILPGSQEVYRQALTEGLFEVFVNAGASVSTSTCGPCVGGHMGVLADGERCVSTTNRNFVGRMGAKNSETYLASPATAAATAVAGHICGPDDL